MFSVSFTFTISEGATYDMVVRAQAAGGWNESLLFLEYNSTRNEMKNEQSVISIFVGVFTPTFPRLTPRFTTKLWI